jgi:hypothetical protein
MPVPFDEVNRGGLNRPGNAFLFECAVDLLGDVLHARLIASSAPPWRWGLGGGAGHQ